jgi:hypothetical protein
VCSCHCREAKARMVAAFVWLIVFSVTRSRGAHAGTGHDALEVTRYISYGIAGGDPVLRRREGGDDRKSPGFGLGQTLPSDCVGPHDCFTPRERTSLAVLRSSASCQQEKLKLLIGFCWALKRSASPRRRMVPGPEFVRALSQDVVARVPNLSSSAYTSATTV